MFFTFFIHFEGKSQPIKGSESGSEHFHQACHEAENLENHNRSKALGVILKVIFKSVPELAAWQKILENHNGLKALGVILNIFKQKIFENHNCSNALRVILNIFKLYESITKLAARQKMLVNHNGSKVLGVILKV